MKYFRKEILFCWHKWHSGGPFYEPNYQQSRRTTRAVGQQFSFICGRPQVRRPTPRPTTQSLPFVIIFIPSGRMVDHVVYFPSHPLQLIKVRTIVQAIGLKSIPIHVGFVVDKITLKHNFLRVFRFFPASIIPSAILALSFICHRRCTAILVRGAFKF